MKYLILVSALLLLSACGTMNAAIDGTQGIINTTLGAVGDGVADIAVAAGADVRGAVDTGKGKEQFYASKAKSEKKGLKVKTGRRFRL